MEKATFPLWSLVIPEMMKRGSAGIGDREEFSVIRHYVKLSEMNFGADSGMSANSSSGLLIFNSFNKSVRSLFMISSWYCLKG